MSDRELVLDAMRSGEWLRTQWIARVAFGLGTAPWHHTYARRVLAVLGRLDADGAIEKRSAAEGRSGEIAGVPVRFSIPRTEWRLGR